MSRPAGDGLVEFAQKEAVDSVDQVRGDIAFACQRLGTWQDGRVNGIIRYRYRLENEYGHAVMTLLPSRRLYLVWCISPNRLKRRGSISRDCNTATMRPRPDITL